MAETRKIGNMVLGVDCIEKRFNAADRMNCRDIQDLFEWIDYLEARLKDTQDSRDSWRAAFSLVGVEDTARLDWLIAKANSATLNASDLAWELLELLRFSVTQDSIKHPSERAAIDAARGGVK